MAIAGRVIGGPVFYGDLPLCPEPLPKFLPDAEA